MTTTSEPLTAADVREDASGTRVFAAGHHDRAAFLAAVDAYDTDAGVVEGPEDLLSSQVEPWHVHHQWWRDDPVRSDLLVYCQATDPGAEPYTVVCRRG